MELREFLIKEKISQADFARKIGVTRARVSQIVNKKANPSIVLAKHIEEVTESAVTTMDLISPGVPSRFKVKKNEKDKSIRG
jgi:transcriptional regulator with XRE-family HTH domain